MALAPHKDTRYDDLPHVPVDHLDYGYIDKCDDAAKLKDIMTVLESGKEGKWPDLEKYCEAKLLTVLPEKERKKILRLKSVATSGDVADAKNDLSDWLSEIRSTDERLAADAAAFEADAATAAAADAAAAADTKDIFADVRGAAGAAKGSSAGPRRGPRLPPVRGSVRTGGASSSSSTSSKDIFRDVDDDEDDDDRADRESKTGGGPGSGSGSGTGSSAGAGQGETKRGGVDPKISGDHYEYWDQWEKFDVDAACDAVDEETHMAEAARAERKEELRNQARQRRERRAAELKGMGMRDDIDEMSPETRTFLSNREKQKGNECFKAKELEEYVVGEEKRSGHEYTQPRATVCCVLCALCYVRTMCLVPGKVLNKYSCMSWAGGAQLLSECVLVCRGEDAIETGIHPNDMSMVCVLLLIYLHLHASTHHIPKRTNRSPPFRLPPGPTLATPARSHTRETTTLSSPTVPWPLSS